MTESATPATTTEDELMARVGRGDGAAFGELFRRRRNDIFRFALHMTGNRATAEDIVQDVFLIVLREASRYEAGRASVVAWLCGIARNCARRRLDRDRPFQPLPEGAWTEDTEPVSRADLLDDLTRAEGIERVRLAVLRLPLRYREVVVLCELQELSYIDAAAAIGCAIGTVRSRLHRGRELLAKKLLARAAQSEVVPLRGARYST